MISTSDIPYFYRSFYQILIAYRI